MNKLETHIGFWSAILVATGMLFSGLIGNLIILLVAPQQLAWENIEAYAASFESIQTLPQAAGLLMVIAFVVLMVSIHAHAPADKKILSQLGVVFSGIYAAIVSTNYIIVLAVVRPNILQGELEGLALHVVGNPYSISWAKEMLGYAFMGMATLVVAPLFRGSKLQNWIRWLFIWNGVAGIAGVMGIIVADPAWVLAPFGLAIWLIWTVATMIPFILLAILFKKKRV